MVSREWKARNRFLPTRAAVLGTRIEVHSGEEGDTYKPKIRIRYAVGGRHYVTETYDATGSGGHSRAAMEAVLARFPVGGQVPCWYDPDDPAQAVIVRGYSSGPWLFLGVSSIFVLVGAAGVLFQLRRRSAPAPPGPRIGSIPLDEALPNVPSLDLSAHPGASLRHRLPGDSAERMGLCGVLFFTLFWNGITWLFVGLAASGAVNGPAPRFLWLFLTPFVLIGLGALAALVRAAMIHLGVGPTAVEISAHPLRPGAAAQVLVSQDGNLAVNLLRVLLVCEERATYQQGTDTRTETRRVFEAELHRAEGLEIARGMPYEAKATLRVPDAAMHSFLAPRNAIAWKVEVAGDVAGWPDFTRSYPIVVLPPREEPAA